RLACTAAPRLQPLPAPRNLRRTQLHDFQRWLDRVHHIARAPSGRAFIARRAFGAADGAQPPAVLDEVRPHVLGKAGSLAFTIEHVKAAAVEYELERAAGRRGGEEVDGLEATLSVRLGPRPRDGDFRDVDAQHVEAMLRQEDRVRPGAGADFQRSSSRDGP